MPIFVCFKLKESEPKKKIFFIQNLSLFCTLTKEKEEKKKLFDNKLFQQHFHTTSFFHVDGSTKCKYKQCG